MQVWPGGESLLPDTRIETPVGDDTGPAEAREAQAERLRLIQDHLNRLGYRVPESGDLDPRTEAGIRAFEQAQGLPVTGRADDFLASILVEEYGRRDQAAWAEAEETGTEAAYRAYAEAHPRGAQVNRVEAAVVAAQARARGEEAWRR